MLVSSFEGQVDWVMLSELLNLEPLYVWSPSHILRDGILTLGVLAVIASLKILLFRNTDEKASTPFLKHQHSKTEKSNTQTHTPQIKHKGNIPAFKSWNLKLHTHIFIKTIHVFMGWEWMLRASLHQLSLNRFNGSFKSLFLNFFKSSKSYWTCIYVPHQISQCLVSFFRGEVYTFCKIGKN